NNSNNNNNNHFNGTISNIRPYDNCYIKSCHNCFKIVWAETNLVGCGYAKCRDILGIRNHGHRHIFVCHYNPQGNTVYMPAFTWASDRPRCSDCPSDAPACSQGLCFAPSLASKEANLDLNANELE
uniref:SCP domain-containing protein n=1 Tax=Elaeophora elaphi TaxID=1147741 RepID=A0A0R3S0N6_9BILA